MKFNPLAGLAFAAALYAGPALAQDAFPVTIEHAFGETTISEQPVRVVTLGWMAQDAVIALGVDPVGISHQAWGGDEDGFLPWVREALEARGAELPVMLEGGTTDVPYETILSLEPDVILAPYSGFDELAFERLAAIAPTVGYAEQPWSGSWQYVVETVGKALGMSGEAAAVIEATNDLIAEARAANPEFEGKTVAFSGGWSEDATEMSFYVSTDPRSQLLQDLGFTLADAVAAMPTDAGFTQVVSFENLDSVETDLLVAWASSEEAVTYFETNELSSRYRPIAEGDFVALTDRAFVMATSAPSPLSIPWGLDLLVPQLADALE